MTIRQLDEATIRQIAAGEVIERPASAVKELVENSLDAGASRVDVAIDRGGKERIRVADDGRGMTREEVQLAVRKHTTSKLRDATDLAAGVGTLGFRGEALYAIGAVSSTTVITRPREGERATELRVEAGDVTGVGPAGRPAGTTVAVTDLFAEMPARAKFLGADATEFDHVNRIVTRYALANPDVAVSLIHDGREVFATTGQGGLEAALLAVYGREVAESIIDVDADGVTGVVSHPETTRATREYLATYVNDRYVQSGALRSAVLDAYGAQLAPDRYPFAALFVDLSPGAVDVNVHPRKLEVRFDDEAAVVAAVREAVETALLDHGLVRRGAPRGRSAPDEADVAPEPPAAADAEAVDGRREAGDAESSPREPDTETAAGRSTGPSDRAPSEAATGEERPDAVEVASTDATDEASTDRRNAADGARPTSPSRRFRGDGTQTTLDADPVDDEPDLDRLPSLRLLGQLHDTYLAAEAPDGLVLIDQHAAAERVTYERLCRRVAAEPAAQALAEPVSLELTAREAALFPAYADALAEVGFRAAPAGDRIVEVSAVPAVFATALDPTLLRDVLSSVIGDEAPAGDTVEARADALLADLACHPSLTGNTSLTEGSIRSLIEALDGCENPYACPHGRPVLIELGADELADRFERDYPGHAGRREE